MVQCNRKLVDEDWRDVSTQGRRLEEDDKVAAALVLSRGNTQERRLEEDDKATRRTIT